MTASSTGRADAHGTTRPRTLVCTAEGIWLWPGTPLTDRRGAALVPLPAPQLYQQVAAIHGPGIHGPALARTIECAAAYLTMGRLHKAEEVVAALALPPVSFDGAALMRAIGRRPSVAVPDVEIAGWPSGSPPEVFERLARVYDRKLALALRLQPVFNPDLQRVAPANVPYDPALHPRWPAGQPDGGQFRPRDGDGAVLQVQSRAQAVRRALELLGRLLRQLRRPAKPPETSEPAPPPVDKPVPKPENPPPEDPPGIGHNRPPKDDGAPAPGEPDNTPAPGNSGTGRDQPFTLPTQRPTGEGEVARWGQRAADKIREALAKNDTKRLVEI